MNLVERARDYLANNAAESGADVLIGELADEIERLRSALTAEREACAKIADALKHDGSEAISQDYDQGFEDGVSEVANRIRARSTPDAKEHR